MLHSSLKLLNIFHRKSAIHTFTCLESKAILKTIDLLSNLNKKSTTVVSEKEVIVDEEHFGNVNIPIPHHEL